MVWPSFSAIRRPAPSLPGIGTDRPPHAMITASASIVGAPEQLTAQPAPLGATSVTSVSIRIATPRVRASASSPSRTSRALCDAGKSLTDSGSSTSAMPTSRSKNATCSASGQPRTILRSAFADESVTNRDSSSRAGRMLHRPPPLMRILRPPSFVRSSRIVSAPAPAAKIAAMVPAAPAPITTTRVPIRPGRLGERERLGRRLRVNRGARRQQRRRLAIAVPRLALVVVQLAAREDHPHRGKVEPVLVHVRAVLLLELAVGALQAVERDPRLYVVRHVDHDVVGQQLAHARAAPDDAAIHLPDRVAPLRPVIEERHVRMRVVQVHEERY